MSLISVLLTLIKNAIPAAGILARDWAPPGAILLYLGENVALGLLTALAVRLRAPEAEHIDGRPKTRGESLHTFFLIATPFTFGAAVITSAVLIINTDYELDPRELLAGLGLIVLFQLIAFTRDLQRLRGITLAESENLLVGVLGRVFFLALAVWAGLILALFVTSAFVLPFIVAKTVMDLWRIRPEALKRRVLSM